MLRVGQIDRENRTQSVALIVESIRIRQLVHQLDLSGLKTHAVNFRLSRTGYLHIAINNKKINDFGHKDKVSFDDLQTSRLQAPSDT